MAQALRGTESFSGSETLQRSLHSIRTLRLSLGITTLIGAAIFLLGTSWDIQWHSLIGRDRTLIPPHIVMLTGVALSGLAALTAILIESLWARRSQPVAQNSTPFSDAFHGSLGAYIAGFAALNAAIGFPLDSYWHSLYGIDVAIWAPFHIMFAAGMAVVALGAAYMLASAARLAEQEGAVGGKRVAYIGVIAALATMMGIFTLLLFDALGDKGMINLGIMNINVFSFLASLLIGWTFVAAVTAVPWRWVATSIVGIYYLFAVLMSATIPAATGWLMTIEHLTFRRSNPGIAIVAFDWPLAPILAAIGVDIVMQVARRRNWSKRTLTLVLLPIILIGSIPAIAFSPLYSLGLAGYLGVGAVGSAVLAFCGAYIGIWFGRRTGEVMQQKEGIV